MVAIMDILLIEKATNYGLNSFMGFMAVCDAPYVVFLFAGVERFSS